MTKQYTEEELQALIDRVKGLTDWQANLLLCNVLGIMHTRNDMRFFERIEELLPFKEKQSEEERKVRV